jgi:hypothetical protein
MELQCICDNYTSLILYITDMAYSNYKADNSGIHNYTTHRNYYQNYNNIQFHILHMKYLKYNLHTQSLYMASSHKIISHSIISSH